LPPQAASGCWRYAIVTGLVVGAYAGLVIIATQVLKFHTATSVATATLVAVALVSPLRRRLQRLVDRRFNRTRYKADLAIAAFAARVRNTVDLDAVQGNLLRAVHEVLEPGSARCGSLAVRATPARIPVTGPGPMKPASIDHWVAGPWE
jgi:hypothetical protein